MSDSKILELMMSDCHTNWMLNNRFKWQFLDEYTFTQFADDENSPSQMSYALGNVLNENKWVESKICVVKSNGRLYISLFMHIDDYDDEHFWNDMFVITDAYPVS